MPVNLAELYSPQMDAVSTRKRPINLPLSTVIHAQLPAHREEGRVKAATDQYKKELEQDQTQFEAGLKLEKDISLADLAQRETEHKETLKAMAEDSAKKIDQAEKEMDIAEAQAEKAEGVQAIGLGMGGAYMAYKMSGAVAAAKMGKVSGSAAGASLGFGTGYGVRRVTGSKTKGAVAGGAVGAAAGYYFGGPVAAAFGAVAGILGGLL